MAKHHITHKEPGWRIGPVHQRHRRVAVVRRRHHHRRHEVHRAARGSSSSSCRSWSPLLVRLNRPVRGRGRRARTRTPPRRPRRTDAAPPRGGRVRRPASTSPSARAIQYARTLAPDELRAVHFDLDPIRTEDLIRGVAASSASAGSRSTSSSAPTAASPGPRPRSSPRLSADGETEVTVLLPQREYTGASGTASSTTAPPMPSPQALGRMPHVNVTIVPYHLGLPRSGGRRGAAGGHPQPIRAPGQRKAQATVPGPGAASRGHCRRRRRPRSSSPGRDRGRVHGVRVQPRAGVATLECMLVDDTGWITVVFLGRADRRNQPGTRRIVDSAGGEHRGRLALLTPYYESSPKRSTSSHPRWNTASRPSAAFAG